jgi:PAS domain S-box-containing protein
MKLVNALLDFSRIEAGRIHAAYEPVELGAFTAELASLFRSTLERAGIALIVECDDLGEPVHVDREMWEKIVFNLLSNAFKFTFEGEIEVRLKRRDRDAILVVRDTGVGIPEDERSHVFERFHRIRGAQGRSFEGTGIGLSLVQELVKLHGGSIAVESSVGVGTTFTVTVPLGTAHLPEDRIGAPRPAPPSTRGDAHVQEIQSWLPDAAERSIAAPSPFSTARVLLADDNADMRGYLERILGAHFQVESFADGEATLARAREVPPDLVITDVMMPRLDGFGLMRELRRDPRLKHVPVILLSARAGEEARVEGVVAGADDYLVKPFSARELLARAHALIEVARLRAKLRRDGERYRHIFESAAVSIWQEDFSRVKVALDEILRSGVTDLREYLTARPELVHELIERVEIRDVNTETLRLFGAADKRELLASLHEVFVPETFPVFIEELVAIAEGRSPFEAEAVVRTRSGERRDVLVKMAFSPADSRLESVLVTLMDVTARKQAERALREDDRRKDEFLAMLSHELRNPMAPLANGIQLLRLGAQQGSAARVLEVMERQVNHLVRLVDDLLETSRISRGIVELQKELVRLDSVVENAIETSGPLIHAAEHQLSLELPEEPLWIEADPVRLGQVLSNVLNNAARYTPAGGRIALRAERQDGCVCITVQDSGSGIDAQTMPHIFEMFVRGRGPSDAGKAGLGIGLALARTLTELHGGTIEAASAGPGRGSEFTIRLPLARPTARAPRAEARPDFGAARVRVLVVDDNREAAETLAELLSELGASVRVANDGWRALDEFAQFDPALVLLDIGMPGMDGYEVAHRLRADFPERASLVVALTGWGQASDRERARAAGFDQHLVKPAGLSDLRRLLSSIGPRGASAELQ